MPLEKINTVDNLRGTDDMVKAFQFLKYGLGVILVFVGLKMVWLNNLFGGKFPIGYSLGFIGAILGLSILVSLAYNRVVGRGDGNATG